MDYFPIYNSIDSANYIWENSPIRKWLNQDFYNAAFSKDEKTKIVQTVVTADANPELSVGQGKSTLDNIFIPSIKEYIDYEIYESRQSSAVLMSHGHSDHTSYWFRTVGSSEKYLTCRESGAINYTGKYYDSWDGIHYDKALWICMWITID